MTRRSPRLGRRWGSLNGGDLRYGGRHFRLVVFPPGTDDHERRRLRTLQWWPSIGLFSAVLVFSLLGAVTGPALALVLAGGCYLGPFVWLRHALRRARRDLCVVHAEYLQGPGTPADLARCRRLVSLSTTLTEAEHALDRGDLTPLDFQRLWGDVHAAARALAAA